MPVKNCICATKSNSESVCKRRIREHNKECSSKDFVDKRLCPRFEELLKEVLMEYVKAEVQRRMI